MFEYSELLMRKIEEKKLLEEEISLLSKLISLHTHNQEKVDFSDIEDKNNFYDSDLIKKMTTDEIQSIINNNICEIIYKKNSNNSVRKFEKVSFNLDFKNNYFKNINKLCSKTYNSNDKNKVFVIEENIIDGSFDFKKLIKDNIISLNILY